MRKIRDHKCWPRLEGKKKHWPKTYRKAYEHWFCKQEEQWRKASYRLWQRTGWKFLQLNPTAPMFR